MPSRGEPAYAKTGMPSPGPQHETELTQRLRLLEAELPFLRRALLRHAVPPADAEDVAQDTVLAAARRWTDYDPARPLPPWLLGISPAARDCILFQGDQTDCR